MEKTNTGYSAFSEECPVYSTGQNITELRENIKEALSLYFDEENNSSRVYKKFDLEVDLKQFFQYYRVLNAKYLANRIGINSTLFSQYVQGRKKPSAKQTEKILNGIHSIGQELSELNLVFKE